MSSSHAWIHDVDGRAFAEGPQLNSLPAHLEGNNVDKQSTKSGIRNHAIPALNTMAMHLSLTKYTCKMPPPSQNLELTRANRSTSARDPSDMPVTVGNRYNAIQRLSKRE